MAFQIVTIFYFSITVCGIQLTSQINAFIKKKAYVHDSLCENKNMLVFKLLKFSCVIFCISATTMELV